jgi:uncharacterized protein YbjT (DUF2867 family)
MNAKTQTDLITGAFSYSGSHIAERLLSSGRNVRTLTFHPDRDHPLRGEVDVRRYTFDDPAELERSLEGVDTLYNTYWVRFDYGRNTFANAIENSRALFFAAKRARVRRIVHVSIANPSIDSPLPYYRGKALVERALAETDVPFTVVRPTLVFGGDRDVLANNIAWMLRKLPLFGVPGRGDYGVQPIHVEDLARICVDGAVGDDDRVVDAAGPETITFSQMVHLVRDAVGSRAPIVPLPTPLMSIASRIMSKALGDVVLTPEEVKGLMAGLLVSEQPPLGEIAFSEWLDQNAGAMGRSYANEVERHFMIPAAGA